MINIIYIYLYIYIFCIYFFEYVKSTEFAYNGFVNLLDDNELDAKYKNLKNVNPKIPVFRFSPKKDRSEIVSKVERGDECSHDSSYGNLGGSVDWFQHKWTDKITLSFAAIYVKDDISVSADELLSAYETRENKMTSSQKKKECINENKVDFLLISIPKKLKKKTNFFQKNKCKELHNKIWDVLKEKGYKKSSEKNEKKKKKT
eukprot:GHVL01005282.1.p1 GENE.GHVL01005282.1~~GHVL01005282.1.p1  ORF type:complete len:203 (+),score=66.74 GHVL01005282.1:49-657(+)